MKKPRALLKLIYGKKYEEVKINFYLYYRSIITMSRGYV